MALEWVVLGCAACAEAVMLLLLMLPGLSRLRPALLAVSRIALKLMISVVPFCLFLLLDIYWKYETRPTCDNEHECTPTDYLRHHKSIMKSLRNWILIACVLLLNWFLLALTTFAVHIEQLSERIKKLKRQD